MPKVPKNSTRRTMPHKLSPPCDSGEAVRLRANEKCQIYRIYHFNQHQAWFIHDLKLNTAHDNTLDCKLKVSQSPAISWHPGCSSYLGGAGGLQPHASRSYRVAPGCNLASKTHGSTVGLVWSIVCEMLGHPAVDEIWLIFFLNHSAELTTLES